MEVVDRTQKRRMRKKRRRSRVKVLEEKLCNEKALRTEATKKLALYQNMSRSFWEQWHWEMQQSYSHWNWRYTNSQSTEASADRTTDDESTYVGRRSFGRVRVHLCRGMLKNFFCTQLQLMYAMKLGPYLTLLFGVNTSYRLVMQYHTHCLKCDNLLKLCETVTTLHHCKYTQAVRLL